MERPLLINFYDQKSELDVRVLYSDMDYTDKAIYLVNFIIRNYVDICSKNKKQGISNIILALVDLGSSFYVEDGSEMTPLYIERLNQLCGSAEYFCYAKDPMKGLISVCETDNFEMGVKTSYKINLVINKDGSIYCNYFNIMESLNFHEFFEKYLVNDQDKLSKFHEIVERANQKNIQDTVHDLNEMYFGVTDCNIFLENYGASKPLCYRDRCIDNLGSFVTAPLYYSVNCYSDRFDLWYVSLKDIIDHLSDDLIDVFCLWI